MKVLFCFYRLNNNLSEVHTLQLAGTFLMPHSVSGVYLVLSSAIISVKKQGYTTCSHPWARACFPITLPSMLFCPQHCLSTATRDWTGLRFYFIGRVRAGLFLIVMWAFNTSPTVPLSVYGATGPQGLPYTWALATLITTPGISFPVFHLEDPI